MANVRKPAFLKELGTRFGAFSKLPGSDSLFRVGDEAARIYVRYSKVHGRRGAFFGLRQVDLRRLEGHNSFLCFLVDDDSSPILVPFSHFEAVFREASPANDGQYKVMLLRESRGRDLYIAKRGRFNVESYIGWDYLTESISASGGKSYPELTHSAVQTLLAEIGHSKGFDIYVPLNDRARLTWSASVPPNLRESVPSGLDAVATTLACIDVIWIQRGRNKIEALFEVEHSTPVYSALLRFNDVLLIDRNLSRCSVASNDERRELFSRQLYRPTFVSSGLADLASFLAYRDVWNWHRRISTEGVAHGDTVLHRG